MSCQSLSRAFAPAATDSCNAVQHRSVRFSSESRSSTREKHYDRDTSGSISLTALTPTMSQSAPNSHSFDMDMPAPSLPCRFPKLEDCAHFHYERVSLGGLSIQCVPYEEQGNDWDPGEGWICLRVRSHVNAPCDDSIEAKALSASWTEASDVREYTLSRNKQHFIQLDDMLHRCIYDRKVSGLPNLTEKLSMNQLKDEGDNSEYNSLISDYVHHLCIIADDSINCGPVLNWLQMDNKGHKLLVANEDSSSINTPAVAAAYSVRKYVSQARDEISFDVGDMISIIDMPGPGESLWWRGKRGFRVGFFPKHCVAVIGDKVPRHMTQPPPIVGSVAMAPIKPVLRKHGKLISLFRSFILSRPSRRSLKQQGILRERVFGCDLGEHLLNCQRDVPLVLTECARFIEARGAVDGIYRLSGGAGLTWRLRAAFDEGGAPDTEHPTDPHAMACLLKMYFRELPNPLCTYQLYESFVNAVQQPDEETKLRAVRDTVVKLPPPHYRTLAYLMRHLRRVSLLGDTTGMTARNMAIVWAPNLLRSPTVQHALQGVAVQAVVTEFLICYAEELFAQEQGVDSDSGPESIVTEHQFDSFIELRGTESCRRPKSLPLNPPTKLLSLEEARRRGNKCTGPSIKSPSLPPPSGAIAAAAAAAASAQLRPSTSSTPKYIEVGSGPNNLPQYHTVLDVVPMSKQCGLKRSQTGWRGLFNRHKQRPRSKLHTEQLQEPRDTPMQPVTLRPVKSCESLASDTDTLAPLCDRSVSVPLKAHTRSSSCDSYFEPWVAELADMRLRLSPQERDGHMFSEEDKNDSSVSTPVGSCEESGEPSPRRNLRVDIDTANQLAERRRTALEDQIASIGYIDGDSPRSKPPEKRQCKPASPPTDIAKRLCKDRDSPVASLSDFQTSLGNVKLRERSSPRKGKNSYRYSGLHPLNLDNVTISVTDGVTSVTDDSLTSTQDDAESTSISRLKSVKDDKNIVTSVRDDNFVMTKVNFDVTSVKDSNFASTSNRGHSLIATNKRSDDFVTTSVEDDNYVMTSVKDDNYVPSNRSDNFGTTSNHSLITTSKRSGDFVTTSVEDDNYVTTNVKDDTYNQTSKLFENNPKDFTIQKPVKARNINSRLSWHGKDWHSTLIKIDWPIENYISNMTNLTNLTTSSVNTPVTPNYDTLESDSEVSESNKHTIKIESSNCQNCTEEKCLKCELKATDYENVKFRLESDLHDSLEHVTSDISYHNLNRLSKLSNSDASESDRKDSKVMTSSHDSSSTFSNTQDDYESYKFQRPNYINLNTSSEKSTPGSPLKSTPGSPLKSTPGSPLKSPLKSTISITFRSPTKSENGSFENLDCTPITSDRDSVYENIDLEKNLSIVEDATVPDTDASLPTPAFLPEINPDLIILEMPNVIENQNENPDVYSQVKFLRKSVDEVNAMILESPERDHFEDVMTDCQKNLTLSPVTSNTNSPKHSTNIPPIDLLTNVPKDINVTNRDFTNRHYENVNFVIRHEYENVNIDTLKTCDKDIDVRRIKTDNEKTKTVNSHIETVNSHENDNGNVVKKNFNVKELATRFESPTEQCGPFIFEKFKAEIKYPTLERKVEDRMTESLKTDFKIPEKTTKLSKNSCNARSLDENAFVKEFGTDSKRNSLEIDIHDGQQKTKYKPDLNLNLEVSESTSTSKEENINVNFPVESITPTQENKLCLIQRFETTKSDPLKNIIDDKKLSRERIEKYKEERRNFLREKYSSQSFRSNTESLKQKNKQEDLKPENTEVCERLSELPKFERRNTVDLGARMRFSLAKSANNLDKVPSPTSPGEDFSTREDDKREVERREKAGRSLDRKEKSSPSLNIKDMAALFELKSQNHAG